MASSIKRTATRVVAVSLTAAAFVGSSAAVALASETVSVPGTVATKPCTITLDQKLVTDQIPPVIVTEEATCTA